jgi:exonuclease SbcC
MQIISIQLRNIKSHRDTRLDFSPGINVLSGPNGIGKSTIFEAIGYALFGVDAQNFVGNVERFVSIGAKKGEVVLVFQLGDGERFRVSRTVGTPANWLLAKEVGGAFEVEEHKDIGETEARLKKLLGLDNGRALSEQFELVIGPFQHEFLGPFVIRQPAKRRDKFDEILGIDLWRKTFNETKVLGKAIEAKVDALKEAITPIKEQVAVLPERVEAQQKVQNDLKQTQQDYLQQQQGLKALEARLADIDKCERALRTLESEIKALKERIENGEEKISSQKLLIGEAETAQRIVVENRAGKQAYEDVEKLLKELRERLGLQRQLEQEVASLDKQAGALGERYSATERSIEQARAGLREEERNIAERRKALSFDEALRKQAAGLPELRRALNEIRAQLGRLDGRRAGLEEGSEKLAEGICPFFQESCLNIADKPSGDVFSGKFAALETDRQLLNDKIAQLEKEELESSRASDKLKACEGQLKGLDEQAAGLVAKHETCEKQVTELAQLQAERAAAQQLLQGKQQELSRYSNLQTQIEAAETELKKHQPARDLFLANREQASKLEPRRQELRKFDRFLARYKGELATKESDLKGIQGGYDAALHLKLREEKDSLVREVGALEQKVENLKTEALRLSSEIEKLRELEKDIVVKQAQVKAYGEKEKLVKFLRNRVFRNVSAALSERFREEISLRADKIYRTIAETDEELYWGENYQIVLRDMADGEVRERVNDQLSGGQTMSAVVALRLAMLQTIGARIAFFDEPTSNLDATRRENLAHAFRSIDVGKEDLTEHWYDQLFLISHDVAFTEVTDQIVHLDKDML